MIPSKRFYLFLFLIMAIAIPLAILLNPEISIAFTLLLDILLILFGIIDGRAVKPQRVKVSRQPLDKLSIGRDNPIVLTVKSQNTPARLLIRDSYPLQFSVSTDTFSLELAPKSTQDLIYTLHPTQRGEFSWGNIQVRQLGRWGLMWHQWTVPAVQKVAVYPDLIGLRSLSIRLAIQNTGAMRQMRRLGQGTEFAELREYTIGDDPRLIDWKATARRSRPLVRVLEPEKEQTLIILLDRGRLMTAQVQGMQRFDWGLNATLSLALAGLQRGDRVGIGVFDKTLSLWLPPTLGQHHFPRIIEQLTPLQPDLLEPDYFGAVTRIVSQQTRRALVVLLTDIVDQTASAELLAALTRLTPRYLPFCVTLRDPQVDHIAHNIPPESPNPQTEVSTAYTRAVALDLLNQRAIAFAQLKRQGVLVLDAPANQISNSLVDRYIHLKARNLL